MLSIQTVGVTGSTNTDLLALARDGAPEGQWLRAERQTGGRGRQGRVWQSPPGNLYASTLVRLSPADPLAPTLALVAAVALHEAAHQSFFPPGLPGGAGGGASEASTSASTDQVGRARGDALAPPLNPLPEVREGRLMLKWPNDLLAGSAKLAGILLERTNDAVVIGFGVNLAHHPRDLDRAATSIAALTGAGPHPGAFLETLADSFAVWLSRWRSEGLEPVRTNWLAAAHPIGTPLSTPAGEGRFDGLDENGALRLRLADDTVRVIHAGDVFLI
ncbi:MAG TPA: biotin--[acetyl-CoA-carboxylase] ligase [Allosphingosinicella sp.]|jgi:BirA family biotin operon repressor/biotin-[acetyl-CoA-carboxylase] ligase